MTEQNLYAALSSLGECMETLPQIRCCHDSTESSDVMEVNGIYYQLILEWVHSGTAADATDMKKNRRTSAVHVSKKCFVIPV